MSTVVFVAGMARSGSTMLDLMLASRPDAASCGEIVSWYHPPTPRQVDLRCSCGRADCGRWAFLDGTAPDRFHAAFLAARDVGTAIDSSKRLSWILDGDRWCRRVGLDARHVVIWKEPKSVAHSYWRRTGDVDRWRRRFHRYYGAYLRSGVDAIGVSYERLVADPESVLADLSARLDRPVADGQVRFWTHDHHNAYGSDGTRAQRQAGRSVIAPPTFPDDFERAWAASTGRDPRTAALIEALEQQAQGGTGWRTGQTPPDVRVRAAYQSGRQRLRAAASRLGSRAEARRGLR